MARAKYTVLGAICLVGMAASAHAQPYYQAGPQPTPQSWSYDPYTSGAAPCPQGIHGDLMTCRQKMPPTYGQPSYWPTPR